MEIVAAVIGLLTSVFVSGLSLWGAKKFGIGTTQNQIVATYKELSDARESKIDFLQEEIKTLKEENTRKDGIIAALTARVEELEKALIDKVLKTNG